MRNYENKGFDAYHQREVADIKKRLEEYKTQNGGIDYDDPEWTGLTEQLTFAELCRIEFWTKKSLDELVQQRSFEADAAIIYTAGASVPLAQTK